MNGSRKRFTACDTQSYYFIIFCVFLCMFLSVFFLSFCLVEVILGCFLLGGDFFGW